MWELQPLSNNRRTTEISLLLGENTSLTISQIPHNFVGLLSLHSLFFLSTCSQVSLLWCFSNAWMHCLFIGKHPCKRQGTPIGAASGTELVPNIVDFANNASWLHILPLEDFDDLIKSSHLITCDSSILSILVIFMLLTFLLGHKRICTICICQCWLVWLKHLLGFPNPHVNNSF
jgi:hypothetical protein